MSNKFKREQKNNEPLDVFKLRRLLVHRNKYFPEYHDKLNQLIWALLPEISYFEKLEYLNNFLGYTLQATVPTANEIQTKQELVAAFRKIYDGFDRKKQENVMQELAKSTFVATKRHELAQFKNVISP